MMCPDFVMPPPLTGRGKKVMRLWVAGVRSYDLGGGVRVESSLNADFNKHQASDTASIFSSPSHTITGVCQLPGSSCVRTPHSIYPCTMCHRWLAGIHAHPRLPLPLHRGYVTVVAVPGWFSVWAGEAVAVLRLVTAAA